MRLFHTKFMFEHKVYHVNTFPKLNGTLLTISSTLYAIFSFLDSYRLIEEISKCPNVYIDTGITDIHMYSSDHSPSSDFFYIFTYLRSVNYLCLLDILLTIATS